VEVEERILRIISISKAVASAEKKPGTPCP
jgi:hypothetical protein